MIPHVLTRLCEDGQQSMANKVKKDDEIEWTVDVEVLFLLAMTGLKPVGVNRHFMMMLIHDKFSRYLNQQISCKKLWDKLDTLYDMAALHESEIVPFPNEETDFELPEDCYDIAKSKYGVSFKRSNAESESTKNGAGSKPSKKIVTPKPKQTNIQTGPKTPFATPLTNKPLKSHTVVKSDIKTHTSDGTPKIKQELASSLKTNKIKRSSSPLSSKTVKTEPNVISKKNSDVLVSSKKNKERGSSPATMKKSVKGETSSSSLSKKPKNEAATAVSKPAKEQTPDSVKKVKSDKEVNKKGKSSHSVDSTPVSKKSSKESIGGVKKKNGSESNPNKTNETSSTKHQKSETKSSSHTSKGQDIETSSGSRKSSPVVKVKTSESSKKPKVPKLEEPSKKGTPGPKRKRIT